MHGWTLNTSFLLLTKWITLCVLVFLPYRSYKTSTKKESNCLNSFHKVHIKIAHIGKVVPVHDMRAHKGIRDTAPPSLNLDTGRR